MKNGFSTLMLLLLQLQHQPTLAAHGDNMGCVGCAITMEHAFAKMSEYALEQGNRMSLTEQSTTQVDISSLLKTLRDEVPEYKQYSPRAGSVATEMTTKWVNLVATSFAGDEPLETNMYNRTHHVCVNLLDYCDALPPPSLTLMQNKCEMCKAVVADIVMVVQRHEGGYALYRTKPHVYKVLDTACSSSILRIPPHIHTKFSKACEEIVEENEHELATAIINDLDNAVENVCVKVTGMCSSQQKESDFKYIWTSSFHQVPYDRQIYWAPHLLKYAPKEPTAQVEVEGEKKKKEDNIEEIEL
jgi:hypothetical protein